MLEPHEQDDVSPKGYLTLSSGSSQSGSVSTPYQSEGSDEEHDPQSASAFPDTCYEEIDDELLHDKKIIGKGRYGFYYKTTTPKKELVVVKSFASWQRAVFHRTISVLNTIYHPNVVPILYIIKFDGVPSGYAMECMDEGSLSTYIHDPRNSMDNSSIFYWIYEAAKGLSYLHETGIVHRDVRPANMLLSHQASSLKISDFDHATKIQEPQIVTHWPESYPYMAPEMLTSEKGLCFVSDYSEDVYSFAVTVYELFTRRDPAQLAPASSSGSSLLEWWKNHTTHARIFERKTDQALQPNSEAHWRLLNDFLEQMTNLDAKSRPTMKKASTFFVMEWLRANQQRKQKTIERDSRIALQASSQSGQEAGSSSIPRRVFHTEESVPEPSYFITQHFPELATEILVSSKSSVAPPPNIPMEDLLQKYPFLAGVKDADFVIEILEMPMSDGEMSRKMQRLLSVEQFEQYKQWKIMGELLNMISDIDIREKVRDILVMECSTSEKATMIRRRCLPLDEGAYHAYLRLMPNEEDFLQLLSPPLRAIIEKKLKEGALDVIEKLIASNGEALWLYLQWKKRSQAIPMVPMPAAARPPIQANKPALPCQLSHSIKVPADRVVGIKWHLLFNRIRKNDNHQCDVYTTNDHGTQVITLKGEPTKVLDAALEIWYFMSKEMTYSENLDPWLADMVSRIWDRQKRLSFFNRQLVELWIGEQNGFKFVRLNAWTYDELQIAKGQLSEEYKKIPAKKIQPVIQIDPSKQVSNPIKPAKSPL